MSNVRRKHGRWPPVLSLCRALCTWATWVHVAATLAQPTTESNVSTESRTAAMLALIPSAPKAPALIPSAPIALIPSQSRPLALIPSQPISSNVIPSSPPPSIIPSITPGTSILVPSEPMTPSGIPPSNSIIPSQTTIPSPINTSTATIPLIPNVSTTLAPSMASTDEGLRPIPAPTSNPGDPDGHHEIPEPNFTATAPCRGCSPVIEISATGWDDLPTQPAAEHQETTKKAPQATISAGPSSVIVSQVGSGGSGGSGGSFVIGTTTVRAGQTATINNTPIVVQTGGGRTEVVVGGTQTVPFRPASPQITAPPALLPLTLGNGGQVLTPVANPDSKADPNAPASYIVAGQTLLPGGAALTISGTTYSLLPSATAIVVNGQTTTLKPDYGSVLTTTELPDLTLFNHVYTANRAGFYVIAPGVTLIPGGTPVTVSGTVVSLAAEGTAAVIAGSTSFMRPQTTVVTLTRSAAQGAGGDMLASSVGVNLPQQTQPTGKPHSGSGSLSPTWMVSGIIGGEWPQGVCLLMALGLWWLAF